MSDDDVKGDTTQPSERIVALQSLIAMAKGEWSDPDKMPAGDPPGTCDWGNCDEPATAWRWHDTAGGWLPVCTNHTETAEDQAWDRGWEAGAAGMRRIYQQGALQAAVFGASDLSAEEIRAAVDEALVLAGEGCADPESVDEGAVGRRG